MWRTGSAAGMMSKDKRALLVRLHVQPLANAVVGLPRRL
jgi:hypothetical protein